MSNLSGTRKERFMMASVLVFICVASICHYLLGLDETHASVLSMVISMGWMLGSYAFVEELEEK